MEKKKLKLNLSKSVVTRLTNEEQSKVLGGQEDFTTSYGSCTGWTCCDGQTADITSGPDAGCEDPNCKKTTKKILG